MTSDNNSLRKIGYGAWSVKALCDELVTGYIQGSFLKFMEILDNFESICGDFGGIYASKKLLLVKDFLQKINAPEKIIDRCSDLSKEIENFPFAPNYFNFCWRSELGLIRDKIEFLMNKTAICLDCSLSCTSSALNNFKNQQNNCLITNEFNDLSSLYTDLYFKWFLPTTNCHFIDYISMNINDQKNPKLVMLDEFKIWRSWRWINRPILAISSYVNASQFLVYHAIHDATHVSQMNFYKSVWSNVLSPYETIFLEAQAMCVEKLFKDMLETEKIDIPPWYPSENKSVLIYLQLGFLERYLRADMDIKIHFCGYSFEEWATEATNLTKLPLEHFQGMSINVLDMPGFGAAYSTAAERFMNMNTQNRQHLLKSYPHSASKFTQESLDFMR